MRRRSSDPIAHDDITFKRRMSTSKSWGGPSPKRRGPRSTARQALAARPSPAWPEAAGLGPSGLRSLRQTKRPKLNASGERQSLRRSSSRTAAHVSQDDGIVQQAALDVGCSAPSYVGSPMSACHPRPILFSSAERGHLLPCGRENNQTTGCCTVTLVG